MTDIGSGHVHRVMITHHNICVIGERDNSWVKDRPEVQGARRQRPDQGWNTPRTTDRTPGQGKKRELRPGYQKQLPENWTNQWVLCTGGAGQCSGLSMGFWIFKQFLESTCSENRKEDVQEYYCLMTLIIQSCNVCVLCCLTHSNELKSFFFHATTAVIDTDWGPFSEKNHSPVNPRIGLHTLQHTISTSLRKSSYNGVKSIAPVHPSMVMPKPTGVGFIPLQTRSKNAVQGSITPLSHIIKDML